MPAGIPSTGRSLIFAFVAVVLCFVGATIYTTLSASAIDEASLSIASNAMPSIEHLAAARTDMRRLQTLFEQYLDQLDMHRDTMRPEIDRVRHSVDANFDAYLQMPTYSGEENLWVEIQTALAHFRQAVGALLDEIDSHNLAEARRLLRDQVGPASEVAAAALMRDIDFNAHNAHDLALRIERKRRHAVAIAFALDGVAILATALAALLALRAVRQSTSMLEAHSRLVEARADELEQFAGRVAHDILSPLSTASIVLGIVERQSPPGEKGRDIILRGQASLERVKRIVDGLLDFARAGARPDPNARADVRAVAMDVRDGVLPEAEEALVELAVEVPPGLAVAAGDGVLTSIISNLVRNAIKYMGESKDRRVQVRAAERGAVVRIEVEDTGPGLPPELGEQAIFEPYVRARGSKQPGIGLGLATVKRIVEAHRGRVGVRSSSQGCLFWVELPRAAVIAAGASDDNRPLRN